MPRALSPSLGSRPRWPRSQVVADYLKAAGLQDDLDALGYQLVGFGCATCIGNSGPLLPEISEAINANDLTVTAVLSGNRNFEGRISPDVKMNYLASPPLVIAYALAGTMDFDFETQPLGTDADGNDVYLKDIWPTNSEVAAVVDGTVSREMFLKDYASVFDGDHRWKGLDVPEGELFAWNDKSTYVRKQTFFDGMKATPDPVADIHGARVLALLGDSVTTDHISPAGAFKASGPAGKYLTERGVEPKNFNSYGSRRGNHEIMVRGTFGNIRLRNQLLASVGEEVTPGGFTYDFPRQEADHDLRSLPRLHRQQGAARGARRQGIRHRLLARLGCQGHGDARRQGRDHRKLRAHPSLQPDWHGRAAVAVPGRRIL